MLSPYLPWPLYGGSSVRIYNILKGLHEKGHTITLLAGGDEEGEIFHEQIGLFCEKIYTYKLKKANHFTFFIRALFSKLPYPADKFKSKSLGKKIKELLENNNFDLIWVNFLIMLTPIPQNIKNEKQLKILLDQHEFEDSVYKDYILKGNFFEKIFSLINLIKLKILKKKFLPLVNIILCVSEIEKNLTEKQIYGQTKVIMAPNGVEDAYFEKKYFGDKANIIILCSNISVKRNSDAILWFGRKIFPSIKKQIGDAEFWVVGAGKNNGISRLDKIDGIKIIGEVKDISEYYQRAKVFVSPYRFGAGTKLKVLEAMASGIPVVSTSIGCRGIEVKNGENIFIENDELDFANKIIYILKNYKDMEGVIKKGKDLITSKYLWYNIINDIDKNLN